MTLLQTEVALLVNKWLILVVLLSYKIYCK